MRWGRWWEKEGRAWSSAGGERVGERRRWCEGRYRVAVVVRGYDERVARSSAARLRRREGRVGCCRVFILLRVFIPVVFFPIAVAIAFFAIVILLLIIIVVPIGIRFCVTSASGVGIALVFVLVRVDVYDLLFIVLVRGFRLCVFHDVVSVRVLET